jgi:hypothetical protein
MNWETIAGIIRHILTFGGGYAVARGWADEATMQTVVAGAVALGGVIWSAAAKTKP